MESRMIFLLILISDDDEIFTSDTAWYKIS
jgi:hypothetical protein